MQTALAYLEIQERRSTWWRLDFWMSQILAWCLNLGRGENDQLVNTEQLMPDAEKKEPVKQSAKEMAKIGQAFAALQNVARED